MELEALILNKAKIGRYSIIGANALVTENKVIPERNYILASKGKIVRQVTDEEIKHIISKTHSNVKIIKNIRNSLYIFFTLFIFNRNYHEEITNKFSWKKRSICSKSTLILEKQFPF